MTLHARCSDCSWSHDGWEVTKQNEKTLRTKAERHERMRDGHTVKIGQEQ